jgi:PAS domain S-box-containing protein
VAQLRQELEDERRYVVEAHAGLEFSRDQYVDLYDYAPVGYVTLNAAGCIVNLNLTAVQILGYDRATLKGTPLLRLVSKSQRVQFVQHLAETRKTIEGRVLTELFFERKGGQPVLLQLTSQLESTASPREFDLRIAITDVTDLRRAEEARACLAALVESSEDAIIGSDLNDVIISWNRGAERLFGYKARTVIGKSVAILIPEERRQEEWDILRRLQQGKPLNNSEAIEPLDTVRLHRNGIAIEIALSLSPILNNAGHVIGVSRIAHDIRRRKRTEMALRESEERLRLSQQAAQVGSFEWNIETGVNRWTPELEALYGLSRGSFPGTQAAWEALIHPDDRGQAVRRVKEAMQKGDYAGEWRVVRPDGQVCWLAGRGRVFKDTSGRPLRMLGVNIDITERKRAEEFLRESEARFHALVDASAEIVWTSDAKGDVVEDSPSWRGFTGQSVQQWLNGSWPDAVHPNDRQRVLALWRKGVQKTGSIDIEYRLRHVSGQWRWMARRAVPLFDTAGAVQGWVGMDSDITERKQAEDWLRKSKEELEEEVQQRTAQLREMLDRTQELYHKAPCGYHSLDPNGLYLQVNDTELQWLGYSRDELVRKKRIFEVLTPASRKIQETALRQTSERGLVSEVELDFVRADGSVLPALLSASAVRDEHGRVFMVRNAVVDTTARRRIERALRESEARLQAILENSPAIMFLKDRQGRYLHVNREFARALRVRREEVAGKTDAEIFPCEQAAAFQANDRKVIETGMPMQFDEVALHEDGRHTSIVTKFPLTDSEGRVYAVGGIVTDVTERRRLEAEVLRASEREQLRIAQDLHDGVGQQLAGIWCLSEALRKLLETQGLPEATQANKMSKLLNSALSQTRSLARGLYPVPLDPNGLMSALRELVSQVSEMFKVTCLFECPEPVLIQNGALATHLYRIAQEAITNAIKHGEAQRVEVSLSSSSEKIILAVRDDGVGIRKSTGHRKGLGLRIMNYRASMIAATLRIQKRTTGGTDVICDVPEREAHANQPDNGQTVVKNANENLHR